MAASTETLFVFVPKNTFSPDPIFSPNSVTTTLRTTLTHPNALGHHTLNAAARFVMYPKLEV